MWIDNLECAAVVDGPTASCGCYLRTPTCLKRGNGRHQLFVRDSWGAAHHLGKGIHFGRVVCVCVSV